MKERTMPLIGIMSEKHNEIEIMHKLNKKFKENDMNSEMITINEKSIKNLKNIKLETVIIDKMLPVEYKDEINHLLKDTKYVLLNMDVNNNLENIKALKAIVITYGFNSKATITASSVEEDNTLLCIQRNIKTISQKEIEQQEIAMKNNGTNKYADMVIGTICLLYQLKIQKNEKN